MRTVHKYTFNRNPGEHTVKVQLPAFAEVLHVGYYNPGGQMYTCIWALVNTENVVQEREFEVYMTGVEIPEGLYEKVTDLVHIGTYFRHDVLDYVFHVFERVTKKDP
jgi:hypothetical protein